MLKDPAKVRESWQSVYGGSRNAGKVAVLEEGMKYQQIDSCWRKCSFWRQGNFRLTRLQDCTGFHLIWLVIWINPAFPILSRQSLEFVKYTLDPWVIRWEQSLQRALLLPQEKQEYFLKLNVDGLLRGDYQSRMNGYSAGRQNGWLSANDIWEMEDMNLIPKEEGGDLYLINGNMTKLKDAGAFAGKGSEQDNGIAKQ